MCSVDPAGTGALSVFGTGAGTGTGILNGMPPGTGTGIVLPRDAMECGTGLLWTTGAGAGASARLSLSNFAIAFSSLLKLSGWVPVFAAHGNFPISESTSFLIFAWTALETAAASHGLGA